MKRILSLLILVSGMSLFGTNGSAGMQVPIDAIWRIKRLVGAIDALRAFDQQHPNLYEELDLVEGMSKRDIARQRSPKLGRAVRKSVSLTMLDLLQKRGALEDIIAQREQNLGEYMSRQDRDTVEAIKEYMDSLVPKE